MCINGRRDKKITSYIRSDNTTIKSTSKLKILGFTFGTDPTPEAHVREVERKFKSKLWSLRFLKSSRIPVNDIKDLYCIMIRPSIEYCAATYHSMLTRDQSSRLENLQARALRTIYGWDLSYSKARERAGIGTLEERREKITDEFAMKASRNNRLSRWFPTAEQTGHDTRNSPRYKEEYARTDRYRNSPIFYMRRRLNAQSSV